MASFISSVLGAAVGSSASHRADEELSTEELEERLVHERRAIETGKKVALVTGFAGTLFGAKKFF